VKAQFRPRAGYWAVAPGGPRGTVAADGQLPPPARRGPAACRAIRAGPSLDVVLAAATCLFSWLVGPLFQYVFRGGELGSTALPGMPHLAGAGAAARPAAPHPRHRAGARGRVLRTSSFRWGCSAARGRRSPRALQEKLLALPPAFFARPRRATSSRGSRATWRRSSSRSRTASPRVFARRHAGAGASLGLDALELALAAFAFVAVPLTVVPIVRFARRLRRIALRGQGADRRAVHAPRTSAAKACGSSRRIGWNATRRTASAPSTGSLPRPMRPSFFVRASSPTLEIDGGGRDRRHGVLPARPSSLGRLQPASA